MATETTYNIVKVEELRVISTAAGNDHIIINDVDSVPLETKKITVENFAYSIKDYVLPIASAEILGGIRVGQGLTINPATGVLSNDIYALNDLNDVQVVNPVPNQVLIYDGTKWTNNDNESILGVIAGDGLSGGGTGNTVTLNVNAGQGIQIREDTVCTNNGQGLTYSGGRNQVDIGSGLTFFGNQVNVNVGQGIIINDIGVSVNPGRGLHFVGSTVAVDIGTGLIFADNVVEVNLTLQDLKNVEITTPSNGESLVYQDGKWVNENVTFSLSDFFDAGACGCNDTDEYREDIFVSYNCDVDRLECKQLPFATSSDQGIVQLASIIDETHDSYTTTAVTPALLMQALNNLQNQIINNGPCIPVMRTLTSGTWTPIDYDNLVNLKLVLAQATGGGGYGCDGPWANQVGQSGVSGTYQTATLVKASVGTSASVIIAPGGAGGPIGRGGSGAGETSITFDGSAGKYSVAGTSGGRGGRNEPSTPGSGSTTSGMVDVTHQFPPQPGGNGAGGNPNTNADARCYNGGNGRAGKVLVYEYYPCDWVDPRSGVRFYF